MNIRELLQIVLAIFLFFLPAVLMASLLRVPLVYRLTVRNRSLRTVIILGNGLLCFAITYGALLWLTSAIFYSIARFYFDTTFGLVPGITLAKVDQFKWGVINEMWLRQVVSAGADQVCFSGTSTTCQLADMASKIGSPKDNPISFGLALLSTLVNLLLGRWLTRPPMGESQTNRSA
jgi:hypothetical protein